ncbi:MAG: OmpA family protein [Spirochaetes bacterium]|nr:OmpA family protein [Spirochaetota bacterium]
MFKKAMYAVLCIQILITPVLAKNDSGKNIILFGNSPSSLGMGGTGVTNYGSDLFYLNPASVGAAERLEFGLQYGTLDMGFLNPAFSFALPTSYGVLGASFRMIDIPAESANDIQKGYLFNLGGAKNFTDNLIIGASASLFTGSDSSDDLMFAGLTLGSIYNINFQHNFKGSFGIYEPSIGASVTAGLPFGENKDFSDFNQATAGYSFVFYKNTDLQVKFLNDFSVINAYSDFPVKFGFESLIKDHYIARAGVTVPQSYEYGDYTLGVGYKFGLSSFDGDINYSIVHYSKMQFTHYLGLNIRYGALDRQPPEVNIESNEEYISPNYDGKQDFLIFDTEVRDRSKIKGWKLQILNSDNSIIREYRISERDIDESLSLKGFFMKIWQKKESMVVPESIFWDGTDGAGRVVPDGKYTFSFVVWDERDNISVARKGFIYVDVTSPDAVVESDALFSPNGDNKKDTLEIKQKIVSEDQDVWQAGFLNSKGDIIKSYSWPGHSVPDKIVWDGRDDKGSDVPEGLYTYFIKSTDKAGNETGKESNQIALTRKYQIADITCSHEYFSNLQNTSLNFYPYISDKSGLEEWQIIIMDDDGDYLTELHGLNTIPEFVKWDVPNNKTKLKDGKYLFKLAAKFSSGNTPESFIKELIVDSTPPELDLSFDPDIFSPDNDGENDILTIKPEAEDKYGIRDWEVLVYDPAGKIFKTFNGKSAPPQIIKWDGSGRDEVESAADYYIVFKASDVAGNATKTDKLKLPIDVLVIVTERGLKIRISNIEFAFDKAELTEKAYPVLNRVVEILNKYSRYNVLIEGHTDDFGEEVYNLKLSENRAKAVMDYLITGNISETRLSFRGMGETLPFLPNTDKENRRRNRRVEFLLVK